MAEKENKEWHREGHSKRTDIPGNRLSEEEIVKGALEMDQLDKMRPENDEKRINKEKQVGASPVKSVNKGE